MLVVSRTRVWITAIIVSVGLLFALPSFVSKPIFDKLPSFLQHPVSLGLELRGGSHIQLEVGIAEVAKEFQEGIIDEARKQLRKDNIQYWRIAVQKHTDGSNIVIQLKNPNDISKVKKILKKIEPELEITNQDSELTAVISKKFMNSYANKIVNESIEVIRHRIDETGTKEPTILKQGENRIVVQLPGVENPEEVKKLIGKTAILTFHAVDEDLESITVQDGSVPKFPTKPGVVFLPEDRGNGITTYVPIKKQISLTGKSLADAQMNIDPQSGAPCVSIKFDSGEGTRKIAELSQKYLHKQFAMVLDGKVLSAPVFQAVLNNGTAQITGHFTMEEAQELALLLRAGSLPAPLTVIEERNVGPSLGADSIVAGTKATIFAFLFVAVFMVASYGIFGVFSVISLFTNIMLLFACLSLLEATLTLPGIAGIALTIGTAVDANVLIYERMREEIRLGIKKLVAIAQGYKMAITTIIDSNLTILFGALVLYQFGSGPIKGFAVTLALGTLISLFTTFFLTKSLVAIWVKKHTKDEKIIV